MRTRATRVLTLPILALALGLLAGLAVPALAQGPGQGPGHGPGFGGPLAVDAMPSAHRGHGGRSFARLARYLELTDEQIEAAQAIHQAAQAEVEVIREAQKALHEELRALLDTEDPDAVAVGETVIELHAGRQEIGAIREQAKADFEALLTAEQLEKLNDLKSVRGHFGQPSW